MVMKNNFYVTLYILIPLILAGITILGIIAAFHLADTTENVHHSLFINVYSLAMAGGFLSFLAGFLILRLFLQPLDELEKKTKNMPVFSDTQSKESMSITDDLSRINQVFKSMANILSHVEARELFPGIIGPGAAMRNIFTQIIRAAPTDSTV